MKTLNKWEAMRKAAKFLNYVEPCGFYKPYKDNTGKVDFMRYCNNRLSYGYNVESEVFYLCESPILETVILRIISEHKTFEELKDAFFKYWNQLNPRNHDTNCN